VIARCGRDFASEEDRSCEGWDGKRRNFRWCGNLCAYVWSPHRLLSHDKHVLAVRPAEVAQGPVIEWLEHRAQAWLAEHDH
jgi:hypothetical protein